MSRWHEKDIMARQMAILGYVTSIIEIETGLSSKQIRAIYKDLDDEGIVRNRRSRTYRSSATIMVNQTTKKHASLLMQHYKYCGGERIMHTICIHSLNRAYGYYKSVLLETGEKSDPRVNLETLSIADAWSLAKELRSEEAMFENCSKCGCDFFTSANQRTLLDCPFCFEFNKRVV